jgi:hypothetical protein
VIPIPRGYRLPCSGQAWLGHRSGAVRAAGLSGAAIADVVKQRAEQAGLDPTAFAGHSLRSGFLTSAAESGASVFKMMAVSRHRSMDTLSGYVRSADLFKEPAGAAFL